MTDTLDQGDTVGLIVEIAALRLRAERARLIARHVKEGAADGIREHALALEARLHELENVLRPAATI